MRRKSKRFPIFFGVVILIIAIFLGTILIADTPFMRVKNDSIKLIQKKTDLRNFTKYYWYNRDDSYFAALGQNEDKKEQYAIVNTSNGNLLIVDSDSGISEEKAKRIVERDATKLKTINSTRLGVYQKKVVWEISFFDQNHHLNYYTLAFKDGKIIQKVLNI